MIMYPEYEEDIQPEIHEQRANISLRTHSFPYEENYSTEEEYHTQLSERIDYFTGQEDYETAGEIAERSNQPILAHELYRKAVEKYITEDEFEEAAIVLEDRLGNRTLAMRLYNQALNDYKIKGDYESVPLIKERISRII